MHGRMHFEVSTICFGRMFVICFMVSYFILCQALLIVQLMPSMNMIYDSKIRLRSIFKPLRIVVCRFSFESDYLVEMFLCIELGLSVASVKGFSLY